MFILGYGFFFLNMNIMTTLELLVLKVITSIHLCSKYLPKCEQETVNHFIMFNKYFNECV